MTFQILPARIQDAEDIATLANSAYRGDSGRQGWTTEADLLDGNRTDAAALEDIIRKPGTLILKCVEEGQLLGCMELRKDNHKLYLGLLTVRPQQQGKGIGKTLLKAAEAEAKKQNCSSIYMTVISVRRDLIDWYVRHGFVETGERKPFDLSTQRFGRPRTELEFVVLEKVM